MKPLTKKQRNEYYKQALYKLDNLKKGEGEYLCVLLKNLANIHINYVYGTYPELRLLSPFSSSDSGLPWYIDDVGFPFSYYDNRIKKHQALVLEFCIEMTS